MVSRILVFVSCIIIGFPAPAQQQKGKIKIVIMGVKNSDGIIMMSLHNKKEGFPGDRNHTLISRALKIDGDTLECEFAKIPYGEYAVALIHDENSNKKLDTNLLGIPTEGIGVSNNAYKMMGPPEYEEARFELNEEEKIISIKMHYY